MSVTKDSFRDWKANPVTKAVMIDLKNRILEIQEQLGQTAGQSPGDDRFKTGVIAAYNDILNIQLDEVKDGD